MTFIKEYEKNFRIIIYCVIFFFITRIFTPDFVTKNSIIAEVYTLISQIIVVLCVLKFILHIRNKHLLKISEISFILAVLVFYIYFFIITFFESGYIRRIIEVAYPVLGTVFFLHNETKDHYEEVVKGIALLFSVFLCWNIIDMIFVRHVLTERVTIFLLGGRNQLAIFLSVALVFFIAAIELRKKTTKKAANLFKLIYFLLVLGTAILSGSSTCIFTIVAVLIFCIVREVLSDGFKIKVLVVPLVYVCGWLAIVVFRVQNLFSGVFEAVFNRRVTLSERTVIWDEAFNVIGQKPLFGYGIASSENVFKVQFDTPWSDPNLVETMSGHNEILQILYYGGVFLLILFLIIYIIALNKKGNRNKFFYLFYIAIIAILINYLTETAGEYSIIFMLGMCYYSKKQYDLIKPQKCIDEELISVVVPIYNVEKYVTNCIDSIINQTYRDLQIILVDDGSTDNCPVICDEYLKKDKRVEVIHKLNGGLSDARNVGIRAAKGNYITFVDSDDFILPYMIEKLYMLCKNYSSDFSTCQAEICGEDDNALSIQVSTSCKEHVITFEGDDKMCAYLEGNYIDTSTWKKLYAIDLFSDIEFPKGKLHEDVYTTYLLIHKAKKIVVADFVGYMYRKNPNSIMNSGFSEKRINAIDGQLEQLKFIEKKYPKLKRYAQADVVYACNFCLNEIAIKGDCKKENEVFIQALYRKYAFAYITALNRSIKAKLITFLAFFSFNWAKKVLGFVHKIKG